MSVNCFGVVGRGSRNGLNLDVWVLCGGCVQGGGRGTGKTWATNWPRVPENRVMAMLPYSELLLLLLFLQNHKTKKKSKDDAEQLRARFWNFRACLFVNFLPLH